uniref:Uncharacterized protein LOC109506714 n=1 Tax=Elaeis guineensis var. tenera TaxID=51953 RepID=A0A6J0PS38_ELAGV|nr:uncharacterized protein LOC109506714 [Elaeis guineensis]
MMNIDTECGWFYNSCKKCTKKVIPDRSEFYCEKCNGLVNSVVPRFKIELRMIDEFDNTIFIVFDSEAANFLQCTVAEWRDFMSTNFGDINQTPEHLDQFFGKKFIFKVQITDRNIRGYSYLYLIYEKDNDTQSISRMVFATIESEVENTFDRLTLAKRSSPELSNKLNDNENLTAQMSSNAKKKNQSGRCEKQPLSQSHKKLQYDVCLYVNERSRDDNGQFDVDIVASLKNMLDISNPLVKTFKMAKGRMHDEELKNYALIIIENLLQHNERNLADFESMPYPDMNRIQRDSNKLMHNELSYNRSILAEELQYLLNSLTDEQRRFYKGDERIYLSSDNVCRIDANIDSMDNLYTNHVLKLKVDAPVMLLRNIDKSLGLYNGTKLIISQLGKHVLEAKVISESNVS